MYITCSVWKAPRGPPFPLEEALLEKLEEDLREDAVELVEDPVELDAEVTLSTVVPVVARKKTKEG